jgi:hypothetical protein
MENTKPPAVGETKARSLQRIEIVKVPVMADLRRDKPGRAWSGARAKKVHSEAGVSQGEIMEPGPGATA